MLPPFGWTLASSCVKSRKEGDKRVEIENITVTVISNLISQCPPVPTTYCVPSCAEGK
jgi:hypothetical protein